MPGLFLIDTDIASYFIRGRHPEVDRRFQGADASRLFISVITEAELLYGLRRLPPDHRLHKVVHRFLRTIRILPWGSAAAGVHAEVRDRMVRDGTPIGEMDLMIAAHAISLDAVLVTNNERHFGRLAPTLMIETWLLGEPS